MCLKTRVSRIAVGSRLCLRVRVLRMELRTYFEPRNNVFLLRCRLNASVIKTGMFEVGIIYLRQPFCLSRHLSQKFHLTVTTSSTWQRH
jgi:hypothetical protein